MYVYISIIENININRYVYLHLCTTYLLHVRLLCKDASERFFKHFAAGSGWNFERTRRIGFNNFRFDKFGETCTLDRAWLWRSCSIFVVRSGGFAARDVYFRVTEDLSQCVAATTGQGAGDY